jgi:hypothetical protein
MLAKRRPAATGSLPPPALTYAKWKAEAGAHLVERFDVRPGSIPGPVWKQLFIGGLTPSQAAEQASVYHNNRRRLGFQRKR